MDPAATPDPWGLTLHQSTHGYRFALEAFLLADFVPVLAPDPLIDLGTGCGVVALLLARRLPRLCCVGLELQRSLVVLAQQNVVCNGVGHRISIVQGDIRQVSSLFLAGIFGTVVCNPPYRAVGHGRLNPHPEKAIARHELTVTLPQLVQAARHLLRRRGLFVMVYHPTRLPELFAQLETAHLRPRRMRLVHANQYAPASMVLIEAINDGRDALTVLPPLWVYEASGDYTAEMQAIFQGRAAVKLAALCRRSRRKTRRRGYAVTSSLERSHDPDATPGLFAEAGTLYVVSTPIGNLADITLRALHILGSVDVIAAEDTRHTRKLLTHHGITRPLLSYHAHNEVVQAPRLLALLQAGKSVALVTDAGTPGIADPAYYLLQALLPYAIPIVPVPGPVAALAALAVSGLPTERFVFEGFLPVKSGRRRQRLEALAGEPRTIVLYESPHRLLRLLQELVTHLGPERRLVVARELTKRFEEITRGTTATLLETFQTRPIRGEFTLVIAGCPT